MLKRLLEIIFLLSTLEVGLVQAQDLYYAKNFGHIHLKPYPSAASVTGISCGEKVIKNSKDKNSETDWESVSFGNHKGYIYKTHLSNQLPDCLQAQYPIFFQSLELDLTEIFLWGKLNDQYIEFETGQ